MPAWQLYLAADSYLLSEAAQPDMNSNVIACGILCLPACALQLALKLHPDKNSAAHAEEAFKAVSKAFSCLSDNHKVRRYLIKPPKSAPR